MKELFKENDKSVMERWIENAYWHYFTGQEFFQTKQPFDPSEFDKKLQVEDLETEQQLNPQYHI